MHFFAMKRLLNSKEEKNKFSSFAINCGAQKKTFANDDEGIKGPTTNMKAILHST